MNLVKALLHKYPEDMKKLNIIVQDDSKGTYISKWEVPYPKPTDDQILEWSILHTLSKLHSEINSIASLKILKIAPEYQQRNMLARSYDILEKMQEGIVLTEQEEAERLVIKDVWNRIKTIRSHAQYLKAEVEAGNNPDINAGWSE